MSARYVDIIDMIPNKLTVIQGCAEVIDMETRNTPDTRHKARTIVRVGEELLQEAQAFMKKDRDAHLGARR